MEGPQTGHRCRIHSQKQCTGAGRRAMTENGKNPSPETAITLAELARHLNLTKGTVSAVLNDSPYARSIPQHTKDRINAAAQELNYRPNFFARTLRKKRTYTVGVIAEEIGDPYCSMLISGIESALTQRNFFLLTVIHRHDTALMQQYSDILGARGVEGFIVVNTILRHATTLPVVAVAGHCEIEGITDLVLDHRKAAELALGHLVGLGHRNIAAIKGQSFSADAAERWRELHAVADELGVHIPPERCVELTERDQTTPEPGYRACKELLKRKQKFTALFAFNDLSAIGSIRAIREAGLRVPEDISVVGFDDIRESAYHVPSLTTVQQPLRKMGEIAAQTIIDRIEGTSEGKGRIFVEPGFVIRESTGPAPTAPVRASKKLPAVRKKK